MAFINRLWSSNPNQATAENLQILRTHLDAPKILSTFQKSSFSEAKTEAERETEMQVTLDQWAALLTRLQQPIPDYDGFSNDMVKLETVSAQAILEAQALNSEDNLTVKRLNQQTQRILCVTALSRGEPVASLTQCNTQALQSTLLIFQKLQTRIREMAQIIQTHPEIDATQGPLNSQPVWQTSLLPLLNPAQQWAKLPVWQRHLLTNMLEFPPVQVLLQALEEWHQKMTQALGWSTSHPAQILQLHQQVQARSEFLSQYYPEAYNNFVQFVTNQLPNLQQTALYPAISQFLSQIPPQQLNTFAQQTPEFQRTLHELVNLYAQKQLLNNTTAYGQVPQALNEAVSRVFNPGTTELEPWIYAFKYAKVVMPAYQNYAWTQLVQQFDQLVPPNFFIQNTPAEQLVENKHNFASETVKLARVVSFSDIPQLLQITPQMPFLQRWQDLQLYTNRFDGQPLTQIDWYKLCISMTWLQKYTASLVPNTSNTYRTIEKFFASLNQQQIREPVLTSFREMANQYRQSVNPRPNTLRRIDELLSPVTGFYNGTNGLDEKHVSPIQQTRRITGDSKILPEIDSKTSTRFNNMLPSNVRLACLDLNNPPINAANADPLCAKFFAYVRSWQTNPNFMFPEGLLRDQSPPVAQRIKEASRQHYIKFLQDRKQSMSAGKWNMLLQRFQQETGDNTLTLRPLVAPELKTREGKEDALPPTPPTPPSPSSLLAQSKFINNPPPPIIDVRNALRNAPPVPTRQFWTEEQNEDQEDQPQQEQNEEQEEQWQPTPTPRPGPRPGPNPVPNPVRQPQEVTIPRWPLYVHWNQSAVELNISRRQCLGDTGPQSQDAWPIRFQRASPSQGRYPQGRQDQKPWGFDFPVRGLFDRPYVYQWMSEFDSWAAFARWAETYGFNLDSNMAQPTAFGCFGLSAHLTQDTNVLFVDWAGEVTNVLGGPTVLPSVQQFSRITVDTASSTLQLSPVALKHDAQITDKLMRGKMPFVHVKRALTNTFWDFGLPQRPGQSQDTVHVMYSFVRYWFTRYCSSSYRKNELSWFLLYWLGPNFWRPVVRELAAGQYTVNTALLYYLLRLLQEMVGVTGTNLVASFHPFLRGFLDDASNWVLDSDSQGVSYLRLPADAQDSMASTLRAHPNTYLIRLSPTVPRHLEFISYRVNKRQKHVVWYRVNVLDWSVAQRQTGNPADFSYKTALPWTENTQGPLSYFWMKNAYKLVQEDRVKTPHKQQMPLFVLIVYAMKQWDQANMPFGPLTTDEGAMREYYRSSCRVSDANSEQYALKRLRNPFDYTAWVKALQYAAANHRMYHTAWLLDNNGRPTQLESVFLDLYNYYTDYVQQTRFCKNLFPSMDNFGDPGCAISPTWMQQDLPDLDGVNPLMKQLYKQAKSTFYSGSLWECSTPATQNLQIWHLVRWCGLDYWRRYLTPGRVREDTAKITSVLMYALRSGSVYPFYTRSMVDNLLTNLGPKADAQGCVITLSSAVVLGLEVVTARPPGAGPGPDGKPPSRYMSAVIPFEEWQNWFDTPPKRYAVIDYQLRLKLWKGLTGLNLPRRLVMLRNLPSIKVYLQSCGVRADWRALGAALKRLVGSARPLQKGSAVREVFSRSTTKQALADTDRYVRNKLQDQDAASVDPVDLRDWKALMAATLLVNAEGENQVLTGLNDACSTGSFPRVVDLTGKTKCDTGKGWIYKQPLITQAGLRKAANQNKYRDSQYLRHVMNAWPFLDKLGTVVSRRWCLWGNQGNRNKTVFVNWLGPDCLRYLFRVWKPRMGDPTPVLARAPRDTAMHMQCNWVLTALTQCLQDPSVYPFISPQQAKLYATEYPGFLVVALSATGPGWLSIRGYDRTDLSQMIEDELDLRDFVTLWDMQDPTTIPFSLLLRALLYSRYGMHLLYITEPLRYDASFCSRTFDEIPLAPYLQQQVGEINFRSDVPPVLFNTLASVFLSAAGIRNPSNLQAELKVSQSWTETVAGWFQNVGQYLRKANWGSPGRYAGAALNATGANLPGAVSLMSYAADFWRSPKHTVYQSRVPSVAANEVLKPLATKFTQAEVTDVNTNTQPTQIPELRQEIEQGGTFKTSLVAQVANAYETSFQDNAKTQGTTSTGILQRLKSALGLKQKSDTPTTPAKRDDPRFMQLVGQSPLPTDQIDALVRNKIAQQPQALGPEETRWAQEHGLLDLPPPSGSTSGNAVLPPMPRQVPAGTSGPTGPMQSMPPFQNIKDPELKVYNNPDVSGSASNYYQALATNGFEEDCEANEADGYRYPAFRVNENGQVVAQCGRESWMFDDSRLTDRQKANLTPEIKQTLMMIRQMAIHWCPTTGHEIRLWRWLGVGCLGKLSLQLLTDEAEKRLLQTPAEANLNDPVAILRQVSREQGVRDLEALRTESKSLRGYRRMKEVCLKRVLFLAQLLPSGILFPYIRNHSHAVKVSSQIGGFVMVGLDWSRSGSLKLYQVNPDTQEVMHRDLRIADLVQMDQWIPTTLRLWVFRAFSGGIVANNYRYYEAVMKKAIQKYGKPPSCLESLETVTRHRLVSTLPRQLGQQVNRLWVAYNANRRVLTPQLKQKREELEKLSVIFQQRNLDSKEMDVFDQLLKLESQDLRALRMFQRANRMIRNGGAQGAQQAEPLIQEARALKRKVLNTAEKLYAAVDIDNNYKKAQNTENIALCSKAEYTPYMREKVKRKYPELSIAEIARMDREKLCRLLLNEEAVERFLSPVYLWQIENFPPELRSDVFGLIDLWNDNKRDAMNAWLKRHYGVSVRQMREWNDKYARDPVFLRQQAAKLNNEEAKAAERRQEFKEAMLLYRRVLKAGRRCEILTTEQQCQAVNKLGSKGQHLCEFKGRGCQTAKLSAVQFMNTVVKMACRPEVPHGIEDIEFLSLVDSVLKNYFIMTKRKIPKTQTQIEAQCKVTRSMFVEWKRDAQTQQWGQVDIASFSNFPNVRELIRKYFAGSLKRKIMGSLGAVWNRFNQTRPNQPAKVAFAMCMLLYVGEMSGMFVLPTNEPEDY